MTQNSKLKLQELISVAFQLENIKGAQNETRSSSPRTCGVKSPTDIFPAAEHPDNRMKKGLMTKPWRGKRTKEHRVIPANDPNVPNTNSWGKQMKGKTQNPETKTAHQINHLMVASWLSKNTKSLKVHASSTILGNQLICNISGSTFLQPLAQHNNLLASGKFFLSL